MTLKDFLQDPIFIELILKRKLELLAQYELEFFNLHGDIDKYADYNILWLDTEARKGEEKEYLVICLEIDFYDYLDLLKDTNYELYLHLKEEDEREKRIEANEI